MAQAPGSLDTGFGDGGKVITSINTGADKAYDTAIQADGKIIAAGMTTSVVTGKDFALVRYNTDGSLDTSFGTNGIVTTDVQLGSDDVAYSLALQADGKIILAGYSDDGSQKKAALVRYNTNGSLDTTFGTSGKVLTGFDGTLGSEIKVVKIHALTGNLIVGGNAALNSTKAKPVIARYTSAGTLDTNFNTTGIKTLWLTTNDQQYLMTIEDLAVQTNGKVTAVGWRDFPGQSWSSDYYMARLNSNGTPDTAFSTDGVNTLNGSFNGHDRAYGLLLKDDNSLVVAGGGYVTTLNYSLTVFEVGATGTSPATANQLGVPFASLNDAYAFDIKADVNGKYVLVGSNGTTTSKVFALVRTNGYTLDTTFNNGGKVTTTFGADAVCEAFAAAIQPDNKIVAVGYTGNDFALARYIGDTVAGVAANEKETVSLYPNPANNTLYVSNANQKGAYTIFDINGRMVIKSDAEALNVSNLASGVYVLKFDGSNVTAKFVKQ